ncbi:hypothetical protein PHMEG_0002381 [Phytophthora megakarya]|uniref:Reverse transcriptase n=1 Tax=Phytophthora megakarya TaxID=4795 RepID=A0A225X0I5_9STRA|nr:hypothetical protein PHMEG_0002381 [Phytophthora megakarya]
MRFAEEDVECPKTGVIEISTKPRSKFEADRESASNPDPVPELVNSSVGDMFRNGEPDESSLVPVFDRGSFVDYICFGGETFDGCLSTLDRLLRWYTECRIRVSFTQSIFLQPQVDFLSHEVVPDRLRADAKKFKRVTEFSFPTSKKDMLSFLEALNYYSLFIQEFAVYAAALYQLKEEDFGRNGSASIAIAAEDILCIAGGPQNSRVHVIFIIGVGTHIQTPLQADDPIRRDAVSVVPGCQQSQRNGLRFRPATASWANEFCGFGELVGRLHHPRRDLPPSAWTLSCYTLVHPGFIVDLWYRLTGQPKPRNTVAMVVAHGLSGDYPSGL